MNLINEPLKKSPVTPWQEMDDQILVLLPKKNTVHELNATASFLWKNIDGARTPEDLLNLLMDEFEVAREEASQDLAAFVNEMKTQGLLVE